MDSITVQSPGFVAQSTGFVAQSTGFVAQSTGFVAQSTGFVAQSTGLIISEKNVTERRETISHLRDEDAFISCIKRVATPAADSTLYTDTQLLTRLTTQLQLLSI